MDIKTLTGIFFQQDLPVTRPDINTAIQRPLTSPAWQPGQVLQAIVLKADNPEQLLLNLQGMTVKVPVPPPGLVFRPGDTLQLQFIKQAEMPLFRILPNRATISADLQTLSQEMRSQLPRQQPLPPLLANIQLLNQNIKTGIPNTGAVVTTQDIRLQAQQFFRHIPTAENIRTPQMLKQALANSGVFLEHNLAQTIKTNNTSPIQQDIRTQLLRLASVLRNYTVTGSVTHTSPNVSTPRSALSDLNNSLTSAYLNTQGKTSSSYKTDHASAAVVTANPKPQPAVASNINPQNPSVTRLADNLLQQTEGVLARMLLHQFQQLKTEEQGLRLWSMELPVRSENNINLFDLRIQREPNWHDSCAEQDKNSNTAGKEQDHNWSVRIAFELEGLGPLYASISLRNKQISVQFHAEKNQTTDLFNQYMDMLGSRLRQAGLDVNELNCRHGQPRPVPEPANTPILDEQA
ncbi:MAG: flagellar hook-length control protein FliK [Gammaproteobacteria bacterium]|nr:flagellar hook-length control protein FliK [Gammaproteobacteria bacterium]